MGKLSATAASAKDNAHPPMLPVPQGRHPLPPLVVNSNGPASAPSVPRLPSEAVADALHLPPSEVIPVSPQQAPSTATDQRTLERVFEVIEDGDVELLKYRLQLDKHRRKGDRGDATALASKCDPLCQCERCSQLDQVHSLGPVSIRAANAQGMTMLHTAARVGQYEIVLLLLQHGAAPRAVTALGHTPLHFACQYNHEKVGEGRKGRRVL